MAIVLDREQSSSGGNRLIRLTVCLVFTAILGGSWRFYSSECGLLLVSAQHFSASGGASLRHHRMAVAVKGADIRCSAFDCGAPFGSCGFDSDDCISVYEKERLGQTNA